MTHEWKVPENLYSSASSHEHYYMPHPTPPMCTKHHGLLKAVVQLHITYNLCLKKKKTYKLLTYFSPYNIFKPNLSAAPRLSPPAESLCILCNGTVGSSDAALTDWLRCALHRSDGKQKPRIRQNQKKYVAGWLFGTMEFYDFPFTWE